MPVHHYKDTVACIEQDLQQSGLRLLKAVGVQRLPEILYSALSRIGIAKVAYTLDAWFGRVFGSTTFARTIYIAAKKI